MTSEELLRIVSVKARAGFLLDVEWDNGEAMAVDLKETLQSGPVFEPLQKPAIFRRVRIGERERSIEWPEPVDERGNPRIGFDANGLLALGEKQRDEQAAMRISRRKRRSGKLTPDYAAHKRRSSAA